MPDGLRAATPERRTNALRVMAEAGSCTEHGNYYNETDILARVADISDEARLLSWHSEQPSGSMISLYDGGKDSCWAQASPVGERRASSDGGPASNCDGGCDGATVEPNATSQFTEELFSPDRILGPKLGLELGPELCRVALAWLVMHMAIVSPCLSSSRCESSEMQLSNDCKRGG
mmetsp:Transcript_32954/g.54457  ORF Transcript_32954/g.54457 Transcript_32954/m.54457 type:complete len:176 (+) Transcript_32954:340-867(+)